MQLNFQKGKYFEYSAKQTTGSGEFLGEYNYSLKVIADLTASCICPVCGAPDCGNDMYIWAQFDDEKLAIHLGADSFTSFLQCWHYEGISEIEYKQLPEFIKQDNELTGWCDFNSAPNKEIDAIDFLKSLELIKKSAYGKDGESFSEIYYPVLKPFVDAVIARKSALNILS